MYRHVFKTNCNCGLLNQVTCKVGCFLSVRDHFHLGICVVIVWIRSIHAGLFPRYCPLNTQSVTTVTTQEPLSVENKPTRTHARV